MAKKVQLTIDVKSESVKFASDETLTLTQRVRILRQELQKVPEGTAEWTILQKTYNETKDSLDRVNIKSKELFGTMSSLPGPIGQVAGQLDNTVGILKTFSSLKFSDIKTQFVELGKDLKGVGSNIAQLTGITSVYTATLNRFTGAAGVASTATKVLAASVATLYAALGIGVIMAVVYAFSKLESSQETVKKSVDNTTASIKKQNEEFELNRKYAAGKAKAAIDEMKLQGKSEKEIREKSLADALAAKKKADRALTEIRIQHDENEIEAIRLQGVSEYSLEELNVARKKKIVIENRRILGREIDDRKIAQQEANNALLDLQVKYYEEDKQKREDAAKKTKDQRDKDLADIKKNTIDATNSLLTEREQARQKITDDYAIKIALAKQYGKDTYVLTEAEKKAQADLVDKYAKEDKDKADKISEERFKANQEAFKYAYEQNQNLIDLDKQRAEAIVQQNQIITQSWIDLGNNISGVLGSLAQTFASNEDLQKIFAVTQVAVNTAASIGSIILSGKSQQAEYDKAIAAGNASIALGATTAFIPGAQALAAGQIASGAAAVTAGIAGKARAKVNTIAQSVAAGAAGAAQIAAILSAKKGSSSSSSSGGGSTGGGSAPTPAFNGTVNVPAPVIGASQASSSGNLGQTIMGAVQAGNSTSRPIQTYVVGDQISTQQQLDRRIAAAAKLGG